MGSETKQLLERCAKDGYDVVHVSMNDCGCYALIEVIREGKTVGVDDERTISWLADWLTGFWFTSCVYVIDCEKLIVLGHDIAFQKGSYRLNNGG